MRILFAVLCLIGVVGMIPSIGYAKIDFSKIDAPTDKEKQIFESMGGKELGSGDKSRIQEMDRRKSFKQGNKK